MWGRKVDRLAVRHPAVVSKRGFVCESILLVGRLVSSDSFRLVYGSDSLANLPAPVAQLDRVLPSEGRGHRFESCRARHHSNAPQGSTPDRGWFYGLFLSEPLLARVGDWVQKCGRNTRNYDRNADSDRTAETAIQG